MALADEDSEVTASIGMRYNSTWAWKAYLQGTLITIQPPSGAALYFNVQENSEEAIPAGVSRKRDFRVQVIQPGQDSSVDEKADFMKLILVDASGQRVRFVADDESNTNFQVESITSASGKVTKAADRNERVLTRIDETTGNLTDCFSYKEGLMQTTMGEDGTKVLSWYAPDNVVVNADGSFTTTGEAYKTAKYKVTYRNGVRKTTVVRQQAGLPEHTITRTVNGNMVTITKGKGDETIIRTYETNRLYGNLMERIESVRGINDTEPVSCTREVKQYTDGGWLLISQTEAYNTPIAQTTTYEYNEQYHVSRINYHNGNYVEYEYDNQGRVTKETRPWGDGGKQMTRNVYAARSTRFYDNRPIKVYTDCEDANGKFLNLAVTDYTYEDSAEVERTTATTYAAGVNHQQVTIDETYGEAAAYTYAAGKPKFSQTVNGVQRWHDYEATSEHGAIHKHTVTTKANGQLIAAQSRKTETFIAANDTTTFEQEFIWDGDKWLLLNTTAYEYDVQMRPIKTTHGNGRFSSSEWMCCGKLRETDENSITTSYGYNSAQQLVETIRSEIKDGDVVVTPETITSYTYDAAGRTLSVRRDIGSMTTTECTEYDLLGRVIKQTDVLGRVTTKEYSADGLTATTTTPAGASFITTTNPDGSTKEISGTGQRAQQYYYDINGKNIATTVRLMNNTILSQNIVNGFGQTAVQTAPATNNRFIYTRSEYNAKGQMVKQYQDTGWNTTPTAPTLYEYDSFGNMVKQTTALSDIPTKDNSPMMELSYAVESWEDGVYSVSTRTSYCAAGTPVSRTQKQLISQLSSLADKLISTDVRGNESVSWSVIETGGKQLSYSIIPSSGITAESVSVDGVTLSQTDHAGITTTTSRCYTATGVVTVRTDGRGNAVTVESDIAERPISVTDALGNTSTTHYDAFHDQPAVETDAQGNTSCYKYDVRGRKIAEWGTAIQPVCFEYDDADNMVALSTFRAGEEIIISDPSNRTDNDTTAWSFHPTTGLELCKTYADNTSVTKTYDAYNRLATETDARGNVKTHAYEHARGLLLSTSYSDGTTVRQFNYNHLGQVTQVTDDAGTRTFSYNNYGEKETDSLLADGVTHLLTEKRDLFGRSLGYTYAKNSANQQTVNVSYGADGRIATAGFVHGGVERQFTYEYLKGSDLLQKLSMPNNMTLTQSYEEKRDLLTSMQYHRGNTLVTQRDYSYDTMGRPLTRRTARQGKVVNDTFIHNTRSELTEALVNGKEYKYNYDNIGNRLTAAEAGNATSYTANELNQYTSIQENEEAVFSPVFDADGNQTRIKTETGIWEVVYNAENRPVSFTNSESNTVVECAYDYMGRRCFKKVTVNGTVTLHQRYIYRGYLQIACCDLTRNNHPALWYITWDPTQPTATRPLAIQKDGTWYTYGLDITKNVCEVFGTTGYVATSYTYSPYGEVITTGNVSQPVQWSSEFRNEELDLVYYNYRDFNASQGEWFVRDAAESSNNLYRYSYNRPICLIDFLGLKEVYHTTNLEGVLGILKNGYDSEFLWTGEEKAPAGGGRDWEAKHPHKIKLDIPDKMIKNAKFIPHHEHHAYLLKGEEIYGKNSKAAEAYRWNCVKQYMRKQPENVFELQRSKRSKAMWVIVKKDAIHKSGIKIMEIPNIDVVSQKIPARLKEAGKGIKISKYINLNSSLFVLSSLAIGYEIYTVRHSLKEVNKVVYGWAGGIIGAKYGAAYAASGAVIVGQVGPQVAFPEELLTVPVGALLGSIMGGIIGSFTGETVTELVDHFTIEKGHEL